MNPTTYFISSILIAIIVPTFLLIVRTNFSRLDIKENCFRHSKMLAMLAYIEVPLVIFLMVMFIIRRELLDNIGGYIFILTALIVMLILGIYLILIALVKNFILENDAIYYTNIFGIQKKLEYLDIDRILIRYKKKTTAVMEYVIVFKDKKKISIDYLVSNFSEFQRVIKNRIKRHGGNVTNIFVEKYTLF